MGFEYSLNDNITIYEDQNPFFKALTEPSLLPNAMMNYPNPFLGIQLLEPVRIKIADKWYDIIHPSILCRQKRTDGYFRVIYIQINWKTGEYYIGKANRPTWNQLKKYKGSGLRFVNEYRKHQKQFERFFIASCETADETERIEASIVTEELLKDPKCLNLVAGGGGTNKHPSAAETNEKKRKWMKEHPHQYAAMLEGSRKAFVSGDTPQRRARAKKLKETMNAEKYRIQFRDRVHNWRENNPEAYQEALRKSHETIRTKEVQDKRKNSLKKWAEEHPVEYEEWQKRLIASRTSEKAKAKRANSLKEFHKNNPELAQAYTKARAEAAAAALSKAVRMMDYETGETLRVFTSQKEAAKWLVSQGIAKTKNCVTSISSVCLYYQNPDSRKGRRKAYGYRWVFDNKN